MILVLQRRRHRRVRHARRAAREAGSTPSSTTASSRTADGTMRPGARGRATARSCDRLVLAARRARAL
ncbi:MAG: hypothetical protein ACLTSX_00435 [Collinsella sp.]